MSYTILHLSEGPLVGVHPSTEDAGLLSLPGVHTMEALGLLGTGRADEVLA